MNTRSFLHHCITHKDETNYLECACKYMRHQADTTLAPALSNKSNCRDSVVKNAWFPFFQYSKTNTLAANQQLRRKTAPSQCNPFRIEDSLLLTEATTPFSFSKHCQCNRWNLLGCSHGCFDTTLPAVSK